MKHVESTPDTDEITYKDLVVMIDRETHEVLGYIATPEYVDLSEMKNNWENQLFLVKSFCSMLNANGYVTNDPQPLAEVIHECGKEGYSFIIVKDMNALISWMVKSKYRFHSFDLNVYDESE